METLESKVEETIKKVMMNDLANMIKKAIADGMQSNSSQMDISSNQGKARTAGLKNDGAPEQARQPTSTGDESGSPKRTAAIC